MCEVINKVSFPPIAFFFCHCVSYTLFIFLFLAPFTAPLLVSPFIIPRNRYPLDYTGKSVSIPVNLTNPVCGSCTLLQKIPWADSNRLIAPAAWRFDIIALPFFSLNVIVTSPLDDFRISSSQTFFYTPNQSGRVVLEACSTSSAPSFLLVSSY